MTTHAATDPAPIHRPPIPAEDEPRRSWTVFALMIAAQFMVILDVSVVNVALPSISEDLQLSAAHYQWTISSYVLLSGGLLLLGGRIADLLDRRRAFLAGIGLFTMASLVSGLAQTPMTLILARAAQGAGAALLTPAALSIIMTHYAGRQRQTALAVWGTAGSLGIAAGVLFGGALTSALGWRAVFFINVPIGIAVVVGTLRVVGRGASQPAGEQHVGADRPLVVRRRQVEGVADGRQRDVHHRDVEDDHELGGDHQREDRPRTADLGRLVGGGWTGGRFDGVGGHVSSMRES